MVSRCREPLRSLTREARGRVIEDQRLGGEPFRRDAGRALPMCRHEGHHGVAAPGLYHQSGHRRLRQCNQPDIQRAVRQPGQCLLRSEDRNLNVDGGMLLAQHLERLWQQVRDRASRRTEPGAPFEPLHLSLNIVQRLLRIGQQPAPALHQHLSDRRRPYLSAFSRQERCADAVFQFSDVEADRGRRKVQCTRRLGE
ncbi:hypothetical protein D9M68_664010 [compost metagenome]